ncbi:hypothetical protein P8Q88_06360 [Qipengyuania sp. XHP0207]|uniref:hypothetical protein n=1 Tax=Qipengyuania sp. XHP0207 TaxID=3038078 RepID=UPI00241DBFCC|nr:hypothetical protein [Qipengyuania sp. XHP0207]MDG5747798.1 hypothetical protein [Qipengyuania sp. XHP0207]
MSYKTPMVALLRILIAALVLAWAPAARADVRLSFHSFNGSVLVGRYPHTFISLEGELDDGTAIKENYGFSAKNISPAILTGPVRHIIMTEKEKWLEKTNRHFTVTIDDAQYWRVREEVSRWRNAPGKFYDLDKRNCIHFVGAIAQIIGAKVDYPDDLMRKPRGWLNRIVQRNPQLAGRTF